jgi:hypothetical protein
MGFHYELSNTANNLLSLMMDWGGYLSNIGLIRPYYLSSSDMRFYASRFDKSSGLDTIIRGHYTKFFSVDKLCETPPKMQGEYEIKHTWQPFTLQEFDITRLGGTWVITQEGNQTMYDIEKLEKHIKALYPKEMFDTDLPLLAALIVRDHASGEMGLSTTSDVSYELFSAMLQKAYPELVLPQQPEVSIPYSLMFHIDDLGLPVPWKNFQNLMSYTD